MDGLVSTFSRLNGLEMMKLMPYIGPVVSSVLRTFFSVDVLGFAIVFIVFIIALSLCAFLAFGSLLPEYQSVPSSVIEVVLFVLGSYDVTRVNRILEVAPTFGPVAIFLTAIALTLTTLNIFIAVVSTKYQSLLSETKGASELRSVILGIVLYNISSSSAKNKKHIPRFWNVLDVSCDKFNVLVDKISERSLRYFKERDNVPETRVKDSADESSQ